MKLASRIQWFLVIVLVMASACGTSSRSLGDGGRVAVADAGADTDAHSTTARDGGAVDAGGLRAAVGAMCEVEFVPSGGFAPNEVLLETESGACSSRSCLVYQLVGDPRSDCTSDCAAREEAERRVFCTCRCDGPLGTGDFCTCPTGFSCEPILSAGGPELRGSYCVRTELLE